MLRGAGGERGRGRGRREGRWVDAAAGSGAAEARQGAREHHPALPPLLVLRERIPCSGPSPPAVASACAQPVSPCRAVPVAHLQRQVRGWPREAPNLHPSSPGESVSQSGWRRAACRSSALGQRDELIAAALPTASEVRGKGWLAPRGSSGPERPRARGSGRGRRTGIEFA